MSNSTELTAAEETGVVTETEDWSEAAVIDNTGNASIRDFDAASEDHPLVEYAGSKAKKTDIQGGGEFVSEEIYEHDKEWVREWLQNAEAACIKRCKMLISLSTEYEDGWLTSTVTLEDGDEMEIPRPISEVIEAARSLGYDPTIVWDVFRDEREIVTEDNGIGMTARSFWENFKSPFSSGSGTDSESGGKFGIGSNSVEKVHGPDGACLCITRSSRPGNHEGFKAYSYRGGATAIDGEVDDDFYGTRFEIPVYEEFDLSNVQEWIEQYTEKLRIPVLYREHDAGSTPVEEEYEATNFIDSYGDPPIQIHRPGEFTIVAGPECRDTSYGSPNDPDTYLVSMEIDRNTSVSMSTLWDVVIQLHDEQGRIVSGPNRGKYAHHSNVYETGQNANKVADLHDDDVVAPVPTGDRGRLKKTEDQKQFFRYISDLVKARELSRVNEIIEDMIEADLAGQVILDNPSDWNLLKKMVNKHGPYRVLETRRNLKDYINDEPALPDVDHDKAVEIFHLFEGVGYCHNGSSRSQSVNSRRHPELGQFLKQVANEDISDHIFMAASTGGKFTDRLRVAEATFDDAKAITVQSSNRYDQWDDYFYGKLKDVPVRQSGDHDYEVSDAIDDRNQTKDTSVPDDVKDRELKIRTDSDNSSIDRRLSIKSAQDRLENGFMCGGHEKLILFPRGADENISDHYDAAKYGAIASVSKKEYSELREYDDVMTFAEFTDWSRTALIATTDGAKTPKELIEDDRMVILTYRPYSNGEYVKLLTDEFEDLRDHYAEDRRNQLGWLNILDDYSDRYSSDDSFEDIDESELPDTLFAVACSKVLSRAEWAFDNNEFSEQDIACLRLTHDDYGYKNPGRWKALDKPKNQYRLMVDTPNWDNSSDIYEIMPSDRSSMKAQIYLGLHDNGIDPTEEDAEDIRGMI